MSGKHFHVDQPKHDLRVEESMSALRRLEFESRNMNLGIGALLKLENEMLQHVWFLTEVESNYLRSWEFAEAERKARYSETFVKEKVGKTDALAKESTNLLIRTEIYDEIHGKWKFKSIKRVCEVANDTIYGIKDRLKSARNERNESGSQT